MVDYTNIWESIHCVWLKIHLAMLSSSGLVSKPPAACGPGTYKPGVSMGRVVVINLLLPPLSLTHSCTSSSVFKLNHPQHLSTKNSRGYLQLDWRTTSLCLLWMCLLLLGLEETVRNMGSPSPLHVLKSGHWKIFTCETSQRSVVLAARIFSTAYCWHTE